MEFSDRYYTIIWEENHFYLLVISAIYVLKVYFQTDIGQAIWLKFISPAGKMNSRICVFNANQVMW